MLEALLRAEKTSVDSSRPLDASSSGNSSVVGLQQLVRPPTNFTISGGALTRESCSTDSADDDSPLFPIDDDESNIDQNGDLVERSRFRRYRTYATSDKLNRRAIANSNERRRMQSINAGFQQLKDLVRPGDTEKLSKAAVLQHAVEFIVALKREKHRLANENDGLLRLIGVTSASSSSPSSASQRCGLEPAAFRLRPRFVEEADEKPLRQSSKRARLDDDLSSLSSSSVSSDEGIAELATEVTDAQPLRKIRKPPGLPLAEDVDSIRVERTKSLIVDREPVARGRVADETARTKLHGSDGISHSIEHWAAASNCGGAVWNCRRGSSVGGGHVETSGIRSDQTANDKMLVKQERIIDSVQVNLIADHSILNCAVTSSASSGDAVVPIAAIDDKVKVDDDRMFSVDCKWTSARSYDNDSYSIVGPEVLSVDGGPLMLPAGGFQSSSMAQRNLETILEAIRFLEGDGVSCQNGQPSLTSVVCS